MKRLNKKTYKAIKQAKAVITITQHGDVVKLNVDFLPPAKNKSPKLFQYLAIKMCNQMTKSEVLRVEVFIRKKLQYK